MAIPIFIPKETTNDDLVDIISIEVSDGQQVKKGDILASIETSKTVFELDTEQGGWIKGVRFKPGDTVSVGDLFCYLASSPDENIETEKPVTEKENQRFTKKALAFLTKHGINPSTVKKTGLITERDLAHLKPSSNVTKQSSKDSRPASENGIPIILYGGGARARVTIDLLRQIGGYYIVGLIDDKLDKGTKIAGVSVLGSGEIFPTLIKQGVRLAVNCIGAATNLKVRQKAYEKLKKAGFILPNLIHPRSMVEPSATMGEGNHFLAGSVLGTDCRLGNNNTINCGAVVSHDCCLGNHILVAPGAVLGGSVTVGDTTLIGMNATIYLGVTIHSNITIFNNSNILADVEKSRKK